MLVDLKFLQPANLAHTSQAVSNRGRCLACCAHLADEQQARSRTDTAFDLHPAGLACWSFRCVFLLTVVFCRSAGSRFQSGRVEQCVPSAACCPSKLTVPELPKVSKLSKLSKVSKVSKLSKKFPRLC